MSLQVHIAHLCEMMNVTQSSMTPNVLNSISLKLTDFTNALSQENDNDSNFHQRITTNKTTENLMWPGHMTQIDEFDVTVLTNLPNGANNECVALCFFFEGVKPWRYPRKYLRKSRYSDVDTSSVAIVGISGCGLTSSAGNRRMRSIHNFFSTANTRSKRKVFPITRYDDENFATELEPHARSTKPGFLSTDGTISDIHHRRRVWSSLTGSLSIQPSQSKTASV